MSRHALLRSLEAMYRPALCCIASSLQPSVYSLGEGRPKIVEDDLELARRLVDVDAIDEQV